MISTMMRSSAEAGAMASARGYIPLGPALAHSEPGHPSAWGPPGGSWAGVALVWARVALVCAVLHAPLGMSGASEAIGSPSNGPQTGR